MHRILAGFVVMLCFAAELTGAIHQKQTLNIKNLAHPHVANELIVRMSTTKSADVLQASLAEVGGTVVRSFRSSSSHLISFENVISTADLQARAERLQDLLPIENIEANQIFFSDQTIPNDPRFSELYGLHNQGATGGTVGADISAPLAWDVTQGSHAVVVGVIDTGIDYTHPDLAPNMWINPGEIGLDAQGQDKSTNGVDDDGNGYIDDFRGWDFVNNDNDPMDDQYHGTHCAGTIGAAGNDGVGVAGVSWQVSLVGLKFLSAGGFGTLANATAAIEYATSVGVDMTSNSWGGGGYSQTLADAIAEAQAHDILFIAAAGNSTLDNDRMPHFPSSYEHDNIIAVAATDHNDELGDFSCYGLASVDVAAPGVDILSSIPNAEYKTLSGTSMATPHVTGVAALIKARYPQASAQEIKDRIMLSSDVVASLAGKVSSSGRANAFAALERDEVAPGPIQQLVVETEGLTSVSMSFIGAGDDVDQGRAKRYDVRVADTEIVTEADWLHATPVRIQWEQNGPVVAAQLGGLAFNQRGYLAVKAVDNVGNLGPLSPSAPFSVEEITVVAENLAETMDGVTADAPWGLVAGRPGRGQAFDDSPAGPYGKSANVSLVLPPLSVPSDRAILKFQSWYNLENEYDYGYVEMSLDEGITWQQLGRLTGVSDWSPVIYALPGLSATGNDVLLRFRLQSDSSVTREGWKVDDIQIYAPQ